MGVYIISCFGKVVKKKKTNVEVHQLVHLGPLFARQIKFLVVMVVGADNDST